MSTKNIKTRLINKHDTEANFQTKTTFIPMLGELIVYEPDENNPLPRIKIGDGKTTINALAFIDDDKVDKVTGKGLSTNDYTTAEKNKLSGIATGANKTTVDSALSSTSTNPVQNKVVNAAIDELSSQLGEGKVSAQIEDAIKNKANTSDLTAHTGNTSNPHSVTKSQVGLGNVPNVATNDQTPTYTDITTLTTLTSGEKISAAFGKIKLAITSLINHMGNKSNPHEVTKTQLGLGNVDNKSSAVIRGELTKENVTTALGYTPPTTDTTYSAAGSSLGLVKSGGDVTIANGEITVKDDSHAHVIDNVDGLQDALDAKAAASDVTALQGLVGDKKVSTEIEAAIGKIDYPVDSVNGKTGAVTLAASDVGAATSGHTHDSYASSVKTDGNGNAITEIKQSGNVITATKGTTFLTSHPAVTTNTDTTSTATPKHGETFTAIDSVARDANGHIIKVNTKTVACPGETPLIKGTTSGSGNAVTDISVSGHTITLTKGATYETAGAASSALTSAKSYTDGEITEWVGDKKVSIQISDAISSHTASHAPSNAEANVQSNWTDTSTTSDAYILNKPAIKAGGGTNAIIEGDIDNNTAAGNYAHAEGQDAVASGASSHAEGYHGIASGSFGHAEGRNCTASGYASHAQGNESVAKGSSSHAEGMGSIAGSDRQHVQGMYNIEDTSETYAHIVGNGGASHLRSNAHTLDWDGNAWFAGDVYIGGTAQDDASAIKLAAITVGTTLPDTLTEGQFFGLIES